MTTSEERRGPRKAAVRGERGFTLVELGVVLLILGLVAGVLIPQFRDRSRADLVSHARRMAVTFRFLRQEAILSGRTYRLVYDLGAHRYWAELADAPAEAALAGGGADLPIRPVTLPEPVSFSDVTFPLAAARAQQGIVWTFFYPDGNVDWTVVHLNNGQEEYTLSIRPLTGAVYMTDRYVDEGAG